MYILLTYVNIYQQLGMTLLIKLKQEQQNKESSLKVGTSNPNAPLFSSHGLAQLWDDIIEELKAPGFQDLGQPLLL